MGFKTVEWAYTVRGISAPQKSVLVALAFCRNEKSGKCFPSQQTLSAMTELSTSTVMRALGGLEDLGLIERRRNFDKRGYRTSDDHALNTSYQSDSQEGAQPTRQSAYQADSTVLSVSVTSPTSHADGAVIPTGREQEVEQELMIIPTSRSFVEFWMVWPRKVAKPQAEKAWKNAAKRANPDVIYEAAVTYATNPHLPDKQFIPHAATWLNGDRWNDELPGPRIDAHPTNTDRALDVVARYAAQERAETRGLTS